MCKLFVDEGRHQRAPRVLPIFTIVAMAIACALFLVPPSSARTISVPGNAPSIKGAMIQARSGDIILVSCGTYRESDIRVKPGVSLWSGTLQPDCVTIDAGQQGRCLIFSDADSTTNVVGFTLRGGTAPQSGGQSPGYGGAVLATNSAARITRCNFTGNSAQYGGALAATGQRGPVLKQCRFDRNEASASGGALHWASNSGSLRGCTLVLNGAQVDGGALTVFEGRLGVSNSLMSRNSAGNFGGALSLTRAEATVTGTVMAANMGGLAGGALACRESSPSFRHCTLHGNDADGDGTVLALKASNPVFESCVITGSGRQIVEASDSQPRIAGSNLMVHSSDQPMTWPGILAPLQASAGNLAVDPLYCSPETGDFHLQDRSPCLAQSGSAQIGALGQGCGAQFPRDVVD